MAAAWADVLLADARDEVPPAGVWRLQDGVEDRLAGELSVSCKEPGLLTEIVIADADGASGCCGFLRVRERLVERSILGVRGPASTRYPGQAASPTGRAGCR